jgi:hypothetical protein
VLLQCSLGLGVPYLTLIVREVLPSESDDLRKSAVIGLNLGRHMLAFNKRGAEKYEGVWRSGYVVLWFFLAMSRATRSGVVARRGKEIRFGTDL